MHITRDAFTEALEASVADLGDDYVYPGSELSCQYVRNGAPSCLIGHTLHRMGVPVQMLATFDTAGPCDTAINASAVLHRLGCTDTSLQMAASAAQAAQDDQNAWGRARDIYRRELSNSEPAFEAPAFEVL